MSPTELEAAGRVSHRSTTISSFVTLEKTPLDAISEGKCQQIEAKKLWIENKMIDIQVSISKQFDAYTNLEEQERLCKDYEAKMKHNRQIHYCNLLQGAGKVWHKTKEEGLSQQVLFPDGTWPIELSYDTEPTTLEVDVRPKIPKWKTSSDTLKRQEDTKSSLAKQQQEWAAVLAAIQNIVTR